MACQPKLLSCLLSVVLLSAAQADDVQLKNETTAMLREGWEVGERALADAEEHYDRARGIAPADSRVRYGWILVLLKHRRYEAALQQLDAIAQRKPENRTALIWRIRVKMLTRQYAIALVDLETLGNSLQRAADADDLQTARFVGRMFGFLEGPARFAANLRDDAQRRLRDNLAEATRRAFDEGRAEVLDRQTDLLRQAEKVRTRVREQRQQERARQFAEVDVIRAQLDMEARHIDAVRGQLLEEERNEAARISRDARQVESELANAEARRSAAIRQMDLAQWQIADLVAAMDCEPDPARHALLRAELVRIEASLARLDAFVRRYDAEAGRLIRRRAELEQDHLAFRQRYREELLALQQREIQLAEGEQQLATRQRKMLRQASDWSPRAGNLATRATALTTYETFPLEQEKQKVLNAFE